MAKLHVQLVALLIFGSLVAAAPSTVEKKPQASTAKSAPSTPRYGGYISLEPATRWSFGYTPIDYRMSFLYRLKNTGLDSLLIERVEPLCECTEVRVGKQQLAPGETVALNLIFNTKDLYGPQNKSFVIHSSDLKAPERVVTYTALVGSPPDKVDMRPRSVFLLPGQDEATIRIRNYSPQDVTYTVAFFDSTLFVVESNPPLLKAR